MCLLAVLYRIVPGYPIVLAANRDEQLDRQGAAPAVWEGLCTFCAPKDPRAGGTWIGCNNYETVVAITNRRVSSFDQTRRSRGLLCSDVLAAAFPSEAAKVLRNATIQDRYNGFNLFCAGPTQGFVARYEGRLVFEDLKPGVHVQGNGDLNDETSWKVRHARNLLQKVDLNNVSSLITDLKIICADHEAPASAADALCIHGEGLATLSSTIIALADNPAKSVYLHAQGSPCTTPYADYSRLLRSILVRAKWAGND